MWHRKRKDTDAVYMGYITCASQAEAESIANALLDRKLIACANIFGEMTSLYVWEGKTTQSTEIPLVIKTTESQIDNVISATKILHSYECPCITFWPITHGNPEFLQWVAGK